MAKSPRTKCKGCGVRKVITQAGVCAGCERIGKVQVERKRAGEAKKPVDSQTEV